MEHTRWYDNNPNLRLLFDVIESLDESVKQDLAQDVIQILVQDFNLNLDEEINNVSKNYDYDCKRWYDEDINLFTSFEIIKSFSYEMQEVVISKVMESLLFISCEREAKGNA